MLSFKKIKNVVARLQRMGKDNEKGEKHFSPFKF